MGRLWALAVLPAALLILRSAPVRAAEDAVDPDLGAPLVAIERAVKTAALVVEGAPQKFRSRSSKTIVRVTASLKGDADPRRPIMVDFEKAPYGTWPKPGARTVLCLASKGTSQYSFQLASYYASVLPATESVKSAIREILVPGGRPAEDEKPGAGKRPAVPAVGHVDERAERIVQSETVLVGALTDVRRSREGPVGRFKVEEAIVGYAGFKAPVSVEFGSQFGSELGTTGRRGAPPSAGRYVLFLRGSETGDGFRVISQRSRGKKYHAAVRLTDPAEEAKIKREVETLADAMGPNRLGLTTIQATLAEWQDAWGARDLDRCIRCYSPGSALRKQHEAGGEGRLRLAEQIKSYPGRVRISVRRVERSRIFAAVVTRTRGHETATVTVLLALSPDEHTGQPTRRTGKMKFVREGREWLILEEGF